MTTNDNNIVAIKANCKKAYEWIRQRDGEIKASLKCLEDAIVASNSHEMRRMYLRQLGIFGRTKTICDYRIRDECGTKYVEDSICLPIEDNPYWDVQITTKQKVRIVPTAALIAIHKRNIPTDAEDVKWYN